MKTYIRRQQHKKNFKHQDIKQKEPPQKYRLECFDNLSESVISKGTSRQRSGKGAISKRFPLQKPEVRKNQTNNQVPIP